MDTAVKRGDHPDVQVTSWDIPGKLRTIYRYSGVGGVLNFGVHNNTLQNLRRGIMERVFYVEKDGGLVSPPAPVPGAFDRLGGFFRQLRKHVPRIHRVATEQFVEHYSGRWRTVYAQAAESLTREAVRLKDSFLSTFVKAEKVNFTSKPDPAPRVI